MEICLFCESDILNSFFFCFSAYRFKNLARSEKDYLLTQHFAPIFGKFIAFVGNIASGNIAILSA